MSKDHTFLFAPMAQAFGFATLAMASPPQHKGEQPLKRAQAPQSSLTFQDGKYGTDLLQGAERSGKAFLAAPVVQQVNYGIESGPKYIEVPQMQIGSGAGSMALASPNCFLAPGMGPHHERVRMDKCPPVQVRPIILPSIADDLEDDSDDDE